MTIRVFPAPGDAAASLADEVLGMVRAKPELVLGLPTGRTPIGFYRELVRRIRTGRVDVTRMTTFNLDEFLGVGPAQSGSYRAYMERHLFQPLGLSPAQVHFLDGSAADPGQECERYERAIAALGGLDVQILGIGGNGHIGFNEPGEWLMVRTHRVALRPETRRANAGLFDGDADRVPREALSMGVGTILGARKLVLLATGSEKARAVERMVRGPLTTLVPASFFQLHGDVDVVLDRAAASRLQPS